MFGQYGDICLSEDELSSIQVYCYLIDEVFRLSSVLCRSQLICLLWDFPEPLTNSFDVQVLITPLWVFALFCSPLIDIRAGSLPSIVSRAIRTISVSSPPSRIRATTTKPELSKHNCHLVWQRESNECHRSSEARSATKR